MPKVIKKKADIEKATQVDGVKSATLQPLDKIEKRQKKVIKTGMDE